MYHDYPWFWSTSQISPEHFSIQRNTVSISKLRLRKVDAVAFSKERTVLGTGLRSCGSHGSYVPWCFFGYGWQMMSIATLYIQDSTRFLSCNEGMDILKKHDFSIFQVSSLSWEVFLFPLFSKTQELWSETDEYISGNHNFKAHS